MHAGGGPIFVIGVPRSGTTLLRYMLSSHPDIYIPPESGFVPRFAGLDPAEPLADERALDLARAIVADDWFFKDWPGERPSAEELVASAPDRSPRSLLEALYSRYALQFGARRWGDKTPGYTEHMALIVDLFPSAQFLHIIRDGRDVALSMLGMRAGRPTRFFYLDVYYAARTWRDRIRRTRRLGRCLGPGRYLELRYEHLTADPTATLTEVCRYLGEAFDPAMLEHHTVARQHASSKGRHAATRQPLTTTSSGRWRREMAARDRWLFEAVAGELLDELGYGPCPPPDRRVVDEARRAALAAKYAATEAGRRSLRAVGVFHPTHLIPRSVTLRPAWVGGRRV